MSTWRESDRVWILSVICHTDVVISASPSQKVCFHQQHYLQRLFHQSNDRDSGKLMEQAAAAHTSTPSLTVHPVRMLTYAQPICIRVRDYSSKEGLCVDDMSARANARIMHTSNYFKVGYREQRYVHKLKHHCVHRKQHSVRKHKLSVNSDWQTYAVLFSKPVSKYQWHLLTVNPLFQQWKLNFNHMNHIMCFYVGVILTYRRPLHDQLPPIHSGKWSSAGGHIAKVLHGDK